MDNKKNKKKEENIKIEKYEDKYIEKCKLLEKRELSQEDCLKLKKNICE